VTVIVEEEDNVVEDNVVETEVEGNYQYASASAFRKLLLLLSVAEVSRESIVG